MPPMNSLSWRATGSRSEYYEDFAQLENGIGLIRKALMQAESLRGFAAQENQARESAAGYRPGRS